MTGSVGRVSGPVVIADGLDDAKMYDVVRVGNLGLVGEIIRLVWAPPRSRSTRTPPA